MRNLFVGCGVLLLAGGLACSARGATVGPPSQVLTPNSVLVDENGGGQYMNASGVVFPLTYSTAIPDSGPGGLAAPLSYALPITVTGGDVALTEPGTPSTWSDLIRFGLDPSGQFSRLYFYSDLPEQAEPPELADTGFPGAVYSNIYSFSEIGPEGGVNGLAYTPTEGNDFGWDPTRAVVTYYFISDVPEPTSLALLTLGTAALLLRRRR